MKKARDIMTGTLITCSPDTSVSEAARLMRDGDTGNVLVTKDRRLVGIITDRDIALQMAADDDMSEMQVSDLMSTHVVTGQAKWDLTKISEIMSKHQIRRLPILDDGLLVGIISLGDLARYDDRHSRIAETMKQISEPHEVHRLRSKGRSWVWGTLGMVAAIATATILTRSPKMLKSIQKQVASTGVADRVSDAIVQGRKQVQNARLTDKMSDALGKGRKQVASARVADKVTDALEKGRKRIYKRTTKMPWMSRASSVRRRLMRMV